MMNVLAVSGMFLGGFLTGVLFMVLLKISAITKYTRENAELRAKAYQERKDKAAFYAQAYGRSPA